MNAIIVLSSALSPVLLFLFKKQTIERCLEISFVSQESKAFPIFFAQFYGTVLYLHTGSLGGGGEEV